MVVVVVAAVAVVVMVGGRLRVGAGRVVGIGADVVLTMLV